jgi:hypothetical protein
LDYDGPATPVRRLMIEIAQAVAPKVFITTGTGGAIGSDVLLGDVVIAAQTRFDCTKQFKKEPWAQASYSTSALPAGALAAITPDLTRVNASRFPGGHPQPKIWAGDQQATVVTTDLFAFDDSTDFYKLQGLGRACDMGDAMVGNAMQACPGSIGTPSATPPTRKSQTRTATSKPPRKRPARSTHDRGKRNRDLGDHRRAVQSALRADHSKPSGRKSLLGHLIAEIANNPQAHIHVGNRGVEVRQVRLRVIMREAFRSSPNIPANRFRFATFSPGRQRGQRMSRMGVEDRYPPGRVQ